MKKIEELFEKLQGWHGNRQGERKTKKKDHRR
jgi:hypothetical protein